MRLYFCKKAYYWLLENTPDAIDEINDGLRADLDYHEIAAKYCGRDAVRGFMYMLAACYIFVSRVRSEFETLRIQ